MFSKNTKNTGREEVRMRERGEDRGMDGGRREKTEYYSKGFKIMRSSEH